MIRRREFDPALWRVRLETLARAGYAARGVIYLIVGGLAALAAWGSGGRTTDGRGALIELLNAPFGKLLLAVVAAGLVCYAAWRSAQALLDADDHGTDTKGLAVRAGLAASAVIHLGLAVFALSLVAGWRSGSAQGGEDQASQEWTAWLLSQPYGRWLVVGVGIAVLGAGVAHFVKAWQARFERQFVMNANERRVITPLSRFGLAARGTVFLVVGGFFLLAALQNQPYGWMLLAVVALGLMAFGAYSLIESWYRQIHIPRTWA
jgi:hypothetical protein